MCILGQLQRREKRRKKKKERCTFKSTLVKQTFAESFDVSIQQINTEKHLPGATTTNLQSSGLFFYKVWGNSWSHSTAFMTPGAGGILSCKTFVTSQNRKSPKTLELITVEFHSAALVSGLWERPFRSGHFAFFHYRKDIKGVHCAIFFLDWTFM